MINGNLEKHEAPIIEGATYKIIIRNLEKGQAPISEGAIYN